MDAIVAVYADWGIGRDGTQPLVIKADRAHFVELTRGKTVLVGRKTLGDFPNGKPLRNRRNIVVTRQNIEVDGAEAVHGVDDALRLLGDTPCTVLGGASVFRDFFPYIDRVYVTKIEKTPVSDVWFPDLDASPDWQCTDEGETLFEDGIPYRFMRYERTINE